jgi:transposase
VDQNPAFLARARTALPAEPSVQLIAGDMRAPVGGPYALALLLYHTASQRVVVERGMPRRIHLTPHLTDDELHKRYRAAANPVERSHWHFLWLLASGMTATAISTVTGYSAYWIGQIARRYNTSGPDGMQDRRHAMCAGRPDLPSSQLAELSAAVAGPHPEGDRWCGRTVAQWLAERLGRQVGRQLGWRYLRRLGARWLQPRPRHVHADLQAQAEFKQHLRPLLREVATAFPQASVELWAADEHRIGLKPILRTVWTLASRRPIAPVEHRYDWRYLVGFVHPASGRTVWHLATTVNIELFSVELEAFAHEVGASPTKQIVLGLTVRAGTPVPKCACLSMSTCASCRRTPRSFSQLSICGR